MNEIIKKLKNGEHLKETEIRELAWSGYEVAKIRGKEHRWHREMRTIIDVDGQLYSIDWMSPLTELQESEYEEQPYKVKRVERVITKTEVDYVKVDD